ncbi:magnesium citrate secondary transporter [Pontibacter harenae]|uniref:magnesium citrate secondary transporter n=1 Tax=Pontibacter harenae TaxID=2894083 RepID=UPI001E39F224|nr:magnesium citrate secondary transporter [Pontibacter harenae]MCC9165345.1 magnesium citrate secondary transporter [Pontibacter harenae]
MKTLSHPVFLVCSFLFCLNRLLEFNEVYLWPLYAYLDDLLCMPLSLSVVLVAERLYFKNNDFILANRYIVWAVVLFAFFFELLLPLFSNKYTADVFDIVAYAVGAVVFNISINRPILKKAES